ncbi:MAG TPA: hypothetical protein VEI03_02325 [Stellaceae bacterium]|nr:hypothetical protein [Stellaceae bacterium]
MSDMNLDASAGMSLGEMVKLLAATLHKNRVPLPFKNQKPWHLLLYTLKMEGPKPDRPKFLDDLVFDWDGPFPTCEELSSFLNALHFTANVSGHNPRFNLVSVDDADAERWLKDFDKMGANSKSFVERAAELASREFTVTAV